MATVTSGRVQYCTQPRRVALEAPQRRIAIVNLAQAQDDQDDDDDEGTAVERLLRRMPLVGPSLADGVAAALPALP